MESFWLAMSEPPELPRSKIRSTRAAVSGRARSRATRRRKYSARDTPRSLARWRARRCISVSRVICAFAIITAPSHCTDFPPPRVVLLCLQTHQNAASLDSGACAGAFGSGSPRSSLRTTIGADGPRRNLRGLRLLAFAVQLFVGRADERAFDEYVGLWRGLIHAEQKPERLAPRGL